ncbi:aldehyde dehydrogenase [Panus rudis PR-1116 ss-1]|nr:aldehyde dehydrogenase [Panus rudis PR-1116 ss-1]
MSAFKPANNDKITLDDPELLSLFPKSASEVKPPSLNGNVYLLDGQILKFTDKTDAVVSVITPQDGTRFRISEFARCNEEIAMKALNAAHKAWSNGRGEWPSMSMQERAKRMSAFLEDFKKIKDQLAELLMWDICKSKKDATDEVERTIDYIQDTITHALDLDKSESQFTIQSGVAAQVKRLPIGVVLASGPFNYPLNECYTTFIPALITGNTVILRIPRNGATPHFPTLPLFQKHFPPGSINILSGSGREIMTPLMKDGRIDFLAFIGQSTSANAIIKNHPAVHRLHTILQMDAKDCAVVLKDADIDHAATQVVSGGFSFNGQRCTAIKMVWVHESIANQFAQKVVEKVDQLKMGMPWEEGVKITPICQSEKPGELKEYIEDALKKGAHILNKNGSRFSKTLVGPTVIGPITPDMQLWEKEQFGPILPITTFSSLTSSPGPLEWINQSHFGLQSAVFGYDAKEVAQVLDTLAYQVGRVNLNAPDKRGPDVLPFGGKKDSGMGVTNAKEAVKGFTIESIVATSADDKRNLDVVKSLVGVSQVVTSAEGL